MSNTMTTTQEKHNPENNQMSTVEQVGEQTFQTTFSPRFDIWEGDNELILYGDLPGVEPESLEIHFENRQLTIRGKVHRRGEGVNYLYSEYSVGDFQRSFMIGEAIDSEGISAELSSGVLTLHLPKSEAAKPRRIEVRVS